MRTSPIPSLRTLGVLAVVAVLAALTGCGTTEPTSTTSPTASAAPITLTDARGKTVTLPGPAVRVAGTEWNVVEYLISLGVQPVGVSDITGFATWDSAVQLGPDAKDIGTRGEPSLDTLAGLDLDAVFVTDELVGDAIAQIEKTTPVIVVPGGDTKDPLGRMWANVDLVATATGTQAKAAELKTAFTASLAKTKQTVAGTEALKNPVAFSDAYSTGGSVSIRPYLEGSLIGGVLRELGFSNAWSEVPGLTGDPKYGLATTDVEGLTKLPATTAYWYIGSSSEPDVYTSDLKNNTVWTSLPFVTADRVHRVPDKIWMFGGPASMTQFLDAVTAAVS